MTLSETWRYVYLAMILAGLVPAVLFPILYTLKVRWWKYHMSTHLFVYSFLFAALYVNSLVSIMFRSSGSLRLWFGLGIAVLGVVAAWQRLWLFVKAQRTKWPNGHDK